jgi:hypothetical protein
LLSTNCGVAFNFLAPAVTTPLGVVGSLNQEAGLEAIGGLVVGHYLVEPGVIGIVFLHSIFVGNPEADEECAGQSDGQAKEVEQGELTILEEITPGQLQIIPDHVVSVFWRKCVQKNFQIRKPLRVMWLGRSGVCRFVRK